MSEAASELRKTLQLGAGVHKLVADYSRMTGIPMSKVLETAITDWMETVGTARLQALTNGGMKATVIKFPKLKLKTK